jgi:hypothetical protein
MRCGSICSTIMTFGTSPTRPAGEIVTDIYVPYPKAGSEGFYHKSASD